MADPEVTTWAQLQDLFDQDPPAGPLFDFSARTGDRITCCITGCARSAKNTKGWTHWICAPHWKLAPPAWRRRCTMFRRIRNSSNPARAERAALALGRTWLRCREAIEAKCADGLQPELAAFVEHSICGAT